VTVLADALPLSLPAQILQDSQSTRPKAQSARARLPELLGRLLRKLANRECWRNHLPAGDAEDVVQETYRQILDPGVARFDPARGRKPQSYQSYLKGLVQNAAQKMALTRGQRRLRKRHPETGPEAAGAGQLAPTGGPAGKAVPLPVGRRSLILPPPAEVERRDTVDFVFRLAAPEIRRALELCYWDDRPIQGIAKVLGMSRFVLGRRLKAFCLDMRRRLAVEVHWQSGVA
jgi:DNA-directed RNA polymerase specialized sigma24 family protein